MDEAGFIICQVNKANQFAQPPAGIVFLAIMGDL
jgi:hypothetical protein